MEGGAEENEEDEERKHLIQQLEDEMRDFVRYLLNFGKISLYLICQHSATSTQQRTRTTRDYMLLPHSCLLSAPICCQMLTIRWSVTNSRSRFRRRRLPGRLKNTRTRRLTKVMTRRGTEVSTFQGVVCWTI